MTPDETRIQTKLSNLQRENLHRSCETEIKKTGPHFGIYCVNPKCRRPGAWISWISQQQVRKLIYTGK